MIANPTPGVGHALLSNLTYGVKTDPCLFGFLLSEVESESGTFLLYIILNLYQSAKCESADSKFWGSIWSIGPTRLSAMRIFARFAFLGPRCSSFFHRHFAATDWPEKLPFLFLGYTPNPFQVFFNTALDSNSTPRRFHSGTLPFCLEILFPNATLEKTSPEKQFSQNGSPCVWQGIWKIALLSYSAEIHGSSARCVS